MTMFYFSFVSYARAALFLNLLKPYNNSESLKQFISRFYLSFISYVQAPEIIMFYFSFISCCASRLMHMTYATEKRRQFSGSRFWIVCHEHALVRGVDRILFFFEGTCINFSNTCSFTV